MNHKGIFIDSKSILLSHKINPTSQPHHNLKIHKKPVLKSRE